MKVFGVTLILLSAGLITVMPAMGQSGHSNKVIYMKGTESEREVIIQEGTIGTNYTNKTSINAEFHYIYQINLGTYPPRTMRVRTEANKNRSGHPLRVTVRFDKGTLNWHVPFEAGGLSYYSVERTLCLQDMDNLDTVHQEVTVIISTSSPVDTDFSIRLFEVKAFSIGIDRDRDVSLVGTSSPVFHYVNMQRVDMDTLLNVRVSSEDSVCAIVSVQPFTCPVSDVEETVRNEGSFQTMLQVASFNIKRKKYDLGAYVVFLVLEDDSLCGNDDPPTIDGRLKNFTFTITDEISRDQIVLKVVVCATGLLIICISAVCATRLCSVYEEKQLEKKLNKIKTSASNSSAVASTTQNSDQPPPDDALDTQIHAETTTIPLQDMEVDSAGESTLERESGTDVQESTTNTNRASTRNNLARNNKLDPTTRPLPKYVNELATKGNDREQLKLFKSMFQKSDLYIWLVFMMGIFYSIPAIQLVLNYQEKLVQSGDQDLCYFNFLCSIPVDKVEDFNHIFSNIWYLGFGLLFVFLTKYRSSQHKHFLERLEEQGIDEEFGIPQHFGIFYAMGIAMIFEGILSACYHVCPTNENFQFDTTFMYTIAVMCFMKIYQFRHPDIASNSYKVFFALGLIMFFEVMGIYHENTLFWILSLLTYFFICVILTSILYHSGQWSLDHWIVVRIFNSTVRLVKTRECSENYSPKRLVLVLLLNVLNIAFIILGAVFQPGISSYLLTVFIGNLLFYAIYYMVLKVYHKEPITATAKGFTVAGLICWIPAFYFYSSTQYSTLVTPAESRNLNEECMLFGMSDSHDIWHMLSAAGLFFAFLLLMTLDDGLFYVPRAKIHIF